jgi:hypothetical protein
MNNKTIAISPIRKLLRRSFFVCKALLAIALDDDKRRLVVIDLWNEMNDLMNYEIKCNK